MPSNISPLIVTVLAAAAVSLVLAPTGLAQGATLAYESIQVPPDPVQPETGVADVTINLLYSLGSAAFTAGSAAQSFTTVSLNYDCPPYIQSSGGTTVLITVSPGQTTTFRGKATPKFVMTRNAPGLELLSCTVKAKATALQPNAAVPATSEIEDQIPLKADFLPLIQAKVSSKVKKSGPDQQVPFEIEVSNFGNAQTKVIWNYASEAPSRWNPLLPEELNLYSPNNPIGKTTDVATFTINTPYKNGWNNAKQAFQLTLTPVASIDERESGTPVTVSMLARVRGVYIPTVEPILMLAAVLGAALVLRMRRE